MNIDSKRSAAPLPTGKKVPCPQCGGASLFAPDNMYRPFCSARCKGMDLGAWASEDFRLAAEDQPAHDPSMADALRN